MKMKKARPYLSSLMITAVLAINMFAGAEPALEDVQYTPRT